MRIDLKDEILIIDEAHNIEDCSRESTTSLITKLEMEIGIKELNLMLSSGLFTDEVKQAADYFIQVVCGHFY